MRCAGPLRCARDGCSLGQDGVREVRARALARAGLGETWLAGALRPASLGMAVVDLVIGQVWDRFGLAADGLGYG